MRRLKMTDRLMSSPDDNSDGSDSNEWLVRFAVTHLLDYILDTEDLSVVRGSSVELEKIR
jgi:hypothetical protein